MHTFCRLFVALVIAVVLSAALIAAGPTPKPTIPWNGCAGCCAVSPGWLCWIQSLGECSCP